MMLEAQATIIEDENDPDVHRAGDIIVVALPGHPWGTLDQVRFLVVEWEDAELEAALLARRAAGEPWPVKSYPYAEFEE